MSVTSNWEHISAIAALVAAVFGALAWWVSIRVLKLQKKTIREDHDRKLGLLRETLQIAKQKLEHPPQIGFDHAPTNFQINQLNEALAEKCLLSEQTRVCVEQARNALIEVESIIGETQHPNPRMADAVNFRQRFPPIRDKALAALNEALRAIDSV
jgi:hypothetical protein